MASVAMADMPDNPLKFEILSEQSAIQSDQSFTVALKMKMDPDWHLYWKNPGDAGAPPQVKWVLPEGYTVVDTQWPTPHKFDTAGMITFGYGDEVILLATIKAPENIDLNKPVKIGTEINYVICSSETCLPGNVEGEVSLSAAKSAVSNQENQPIFEEARKKLPQLPTEATAIRKKGGIEFVIHLPKGSPTSYESAFFFPENSEVVDHKADIKLIPSEEAEDHYTVILQEPDPSVKGDIQLKGVLVLNDGYSLSGWDIEVPVHKPHSEDEAISMADPHVGSPILKVIDEKRSKIEDQKGTAKPGEKVPVIIQPEQEISGFGVALIFALIGGIILNLMPCVLPVISVKILSFVQMAGNKRGLIFRHGLYFTFGVLVSFWVLAGLLLMLQAYGQAVGWGFQLQEPLFVAGLAAFMLVFALSLFGVFEMGTFLSSWAGEKQTSKHSNSVIGSFLSGVLATAVATPCTGPFLGTAIGYAVTLDPMGAMTIFTFVGLGMALPYLFLSAFPSFLKWLPRPGNWMVAFKQFMGFLMLAAVLWLIWVFASQTNSLALIVLLTALFVMTFGFWIYGTWGTPMHSRKVRRVSIIVALIFALVSMKMIQLSASDTFAGASSHADEQVASGWEPYSPQRVAELQKQGIPVFIDFTAKWCLICQANHVILTMPKVDEIFNNKHVVKMKADWTRSDPIITTALRAFGRNSVPLYLLYDGKSDTPSVLPQVLTPEIVIQQVKQIQ